MTQKKSSSDSKRPVASGRQTEIAKERASLVSDSVLHDALDELDEYFSYGSGYMCPSCRGALRQNHEKGTMEIKHAPMCRLVRVRNAIREVLGDT